MSNPVEILKSAIAVAKSSRTYLDRQIARLRLDDKPISDALSSYRHALVELDAAVTEFEKENLGHKS